MTNETRSDKYVPKNGDDLHNYNAYCYLHNLKPFINQLTNAKGDGLLVGVRDIYDPTYAYGNLYTELQQKLDLLKPNRFDPDFRKAFRAIYINDNESLENTHRLIKTVLDKHNHSTSAASAITKHLNQGQNRSGNQVNPQKMETTVEKLYALFGANFKPQHATSIPSVRHYNYQTDNAPVEIRMGTQGQYLSHNPKVAPIFKSWLDAQHIDNPGENGITHIYFNNLGFDRDSIEGKREKALTHALHELNDKTGAAVITLPADKGFFSGKKILSGKQKMTQKAFNDQVQSYFDHSSNPQRPDGDLYIPKKIEDLLFHEKDKTEMLTTWLANSYSAMGITQKDEDMLTDEALQAVYFHFIKYELTNAILEAVKPKSFNISCKDGIDRAGSASLYYNLIKSFQTDRPMNQDEFERNLHGPATLVKGRGMNVHRERVWSVVNHYVNAHYKELDQNEGKQWLIYWRDMNVPKQKQHLVFQKNLEQILVSLSDKAITNDKVIVVGSFLEHCQQLGKDNAYDKRFLMDMAHHAKAIAKASLSVGENVKDNINVAVGKMEERLKNYPGEIKKPGIFSLIAQFFRALGRAFSQETGSGYQTNKKNEFHSHQIFHQFKDKAKTSKNNDVLNDEQQTEDTEDDAGSESPTRP